jgi:hypothetical protein
MAGIKANRQKSLRSFLAFCDQVEFAPEPFQKKIAGAFFGPKARSLEISGHLPHTQLWTRAL